MSYDADDYDRNRAGAKPGVKTGPRVSALRSKYIEARVAGLSPIQSAKRAGYTDAKRNSKDLEKHPEVTTALISVRTHVRKVSIYTREKVFELIEEGLQMSKSAADPMAFFKGVTEINKMQGFYAAEKHELGMSPELAALQGHLSGLTDAQLLERLGGEKGITIEAKKDMYTVQATKDPLPHS